MSYYTVPLELPKECNEYKIVRPSRLNIMTLYPEHPKREQNLKFTPLRETMSIPTPFICKFQLPSPPPPSAKSLVAILIACNIKVDELANALFQKSSGF